MPGKLPNKPGVSNWVESAGGLPNYIEDIAVNIYEGQKKKDVGAAIAAAVNTVKRWAAGGTTKKKGGQNVKADTVAKAQKALAEWEAKKAKSHVNASINDDDFALHLAMQVELADDDDFDFGVFELALSQERADRDVPRAGLDLAIRFDPLEHPRDLYGQFRKTIDQLDIGEAVRLPSGVRVTAKRNDSGPGGIPEREVLEVEDADGNVVESYEKEDGATDAAQHALRENDAAVADLKVELRRHIDEGAQERDLMEVMDTLEDPVDYLDEPDIDHPVGGASAAPVEAIQDPQSVLDEISDSLTGIGDPRIDALVELEREVWPEDADDPALTAAQVRERWEVINRRSSAQRAHDHAKWKGEHNRRLHRGGLSMSLDTPVNDEAYDRALKRERKTR